MSSHSERDFDPRYVARYWFTLVAAGAVLFVIASVVVPMLL